MTNRVGFDIEFLLKQGTTVIPSQGIIPGTKRRPFKTPHGLIHRDNVTAEVGGPPADNEDEFLANVLSVMNDLREVLPDGITYHAQASAEFDIYSFTSEECLEFGCERDYSAWDHVSPITERDPFSGLRTAGGHVHLDLGEKPKRKDAQSIIKVADYLLGAPSLLFDTDMDRRKLYGPMGCYRTKPYGVEYRTMSSRWAATEEWIRWVYRQADRIITEGNNLYDVIRNNPFPLDKYFAEGIDEECVSYLTQELGVEMPPQEQEVRGWIC